MMTLCSRQAPAGLRGCHDVIERASWPGSAWRAVRPARRGLSVKIPLNQRCVRCQPHYRKPVAFVSDSVIFLSFLLNWTTVDRWLPNEKQGFLRIKIIGVEDGE